MFWNSIFEVFCFETPFLKMVLTLSFTPYQTFIFLEILFKIRNQHKILRKKIDKKFYFLSKPLKMTFRTPKLQTLIKSVGNIFDHRDPTQNPTLNYGNQHKREPTQREPTQNPTLNWPFSTKWYPCLHTSLFCYSCAVHNNLA